MYLFLDLFQHIQAKIKSTNQTMTAALHADNLPKWCSIPSPEIHLFNKSNEEHQHYPHD